jgi:putative hydrolase of the HAD superfamily
MPLKAIVFDLDGTLVDQEGAERDALKELYEKKLKLASKPPYHLFLRDWRNIADEFLQRFLDNTMGFDEQRIRRFEALYAKYNETCPPGEAERLHQAYGAIYRAHWRAFDETRPTLEALQRAGWRLAVITNGDGDAQRGKLAATGLTEFFESVIVSGEVKVAKPDPGIFRLSEKNLGLKPEELAYVGDRMDVDVQGARAAGWTAIWLDRKGMPGTAASETGVRIINRLSELADLPAA